MARSPFGPGVGTPPVPDEAKPFLQYLPMLGSFIQSNRRPTRGELTLLQVFAPDAFRRLKSLTYDEIITLASPYEADPEFGVYVRLVKSDQGRAWITDVLTQMHSM
jgi:hypothetical protein